MANDNFPRGLVPANWPKISGHFYRVGSATDVFLGEVVDLASTGFVTNAVDVSTAGIVQALGVACGFAGPLKKGLACDDPFLDASDLAPLASGLEAGDRWVFVADDPDQVFIVQGDTGGTIAGLASVGETAALIYRSAGSGNTSSGWANLEMDASTNAASTGQIVRIVGIHDAVNVDGTENTAAANYCKYQVRIMNHRLKQATLTTAI
jgi:hypothetical protein